MGIFKKDIKDGLDNLTKELNNLKEQYKKDEEDYKRKTGIDLHLKICDIDIIQSSLNYMDYKKRYEDTLFGNSSVETEEYRIHKLINNYLNNQG